MVYLHIWWCRKAYPRISTASILFRVLVLLLLVRYRFNTNGCKRVDIIKHCINVRLLFKSQFSQIVWLFLTLFGIVHNYVCLVSSKVGIWFFKIKNVYLLYWGCHHECVSVSQVQGICFSIYKIDFTYLNVSDW